MFIIRSGQKLIHFSGLKEATRITWIEFGAMISADNFRFILRRLDYYKHAIFDRSCEYIS